MKKFGTACLCGAVEYAIPDAPQYASRCHCMECQHLLLSAAPTAKLRSRHPAPKGEQLSATAPARRAARVAVEIVLALALGAVSIQSSAQVLWYGGDIDISSPQLNNTETLDRSSISYVLTNFVVPDNARWHVTALFSNNLPSGPSAAAPFTQARWSIRTDVAPGDFGKVLFSGVGPATQTLTGRTFGEPEINVTVSGLSLDLGAGSYYMMVSPITASIPAYMVAASVSVNRIGPPGPGGTFQEGHPGGGVSDYMIKVSSGSASMGVTGTALLAPQAAQPIPSVGDLGLALLSFTLVLLGLLRLSRGRNRTRLPAG